MTVHIDWPRVEEVCGRLLAASRENAHPYGELWALPQTFIPEAIKSDPLVHARFLFCVCHYMRGTIKSDHAVKQLVKMWEKTPHYFDPEYVATSVTVSELEEVLARYIGYKKAEMATFWHDNLARLARCWNADPRLLFAGEMTSQLMYERIRGRHLPKRELTDGGEARSGFLGFQKKMASMLAYFLMDAGLVPPFTASPPVDFHLIRVMLATGMLLPQGRENGSDYRYEHLEPLGVQVLERYAHDHCVSMVELGNAFWMLSVVLCGAAPGTRSTAVEKDEQTGKKIYPQPIPVNWENGTDVTSYLQTCGRCPAQELCSLNIYAGPYYQQGSLIYLPRQRPPTTLGLFGELPHDLHPRRQRGRKLATPASDTAGERNTQLSLLE